MNLQLRKGGVTDGDAYIELLHLVKEGMEHSDWFFLDPDDDYRQMLCSGIMKLWVAEDGSRLAGGFDLIIPGLKPFNYGYDLGFSKEELLRVVQMDTAAVHPAYRGLGLQKKLMEMAEAEAAREPGRILLTTVHPDNCYSLSNILKQGYTIARKLDKYGSVRYILRKNLP